MKAVKVGDVIRLGDWPFADARVVRLYKHETCGWRMDVERPYQTLDGKGGVEKVDFLNPEYDYPVVRIA